MVAIVVVTVVVVTVATVVVDLEVLRYDPQREPDLRRGPDLPRQELRPATNREAVCLRLELERGV